MNKLSFTWLIVCLTTLFSGVAMADGTQIYKWMDGQGVVHYSDKAPSQVEHSVTRMSMPTLPAPDPKAQAADQAWIASINTWYQSVLKDQAQLQYEQFLESEEAQPQLPESTPDYTEQVSYVTPVYGNYWRSGFSHRLHSSPPTHRPQPRQPMFQSSIWSAQPNPFTQQLYKP
ncbi:MAG: DUF4124 domain-containing protein [Gammaproteobacteria bacterium]